MAREDENARREASKTALAAAAAKSDGGESMPNKGGDADTDEDGESGGESDAEGPQPDSIWAVNEKERMMETADDVSGCGGSSSSSSSSTGDGPESKRPRY